MGHQGIGSDEQLNHAMHLQKSPAGPSAVTMPGYLPSQNAQKYMRIRQKCRMNETQILVEGGL
jgi:16S rRNA C1402 (ribose-2'-O) methylase RsmI